ncbi:MAG: hypothetical protein Q7S14_01485, partial [bacterium]|nr:hypothetical protein [bacterium]
RVGDVTAGNCTLTCTANETGVHVTGTSGCGSVSINWFASRCNSGTGLCSGASANASGIPFNGGMSGSGCDYQAEVFASGGGASCSDVGSGSNCNPTPTPTPTPPTQKDAACAQVVADKTLSTLKLNDVVTFTGYGWVDKTADSIDQINFIISKDGVEVSNTNVAAVRAASRDVAGQYYYSAVKAYTISSVGSYSVKIRAHWVGGNIWRD